MKHRLLSVFLIVSVMASAFAGAMAVSVLPAEASYGLEKYTGDFYEEILSYGVVDSGLEGWFEWLADVADYSNGNRDKFVCAFESDSFIQISVYIRNSNFELYSRQYVNSNDNYNGIGWNQSDWYETACTFAVLGNLRFNKTNNYLSYGHSDGFSQNHTVMCMLRNESFSFEDTYWFNKSSTNMAYPCRDLILNQNIMVYCNRQIYTGADSSFGFQYSANLVPGNAPVIIQDFHWFKFNLGDRWYITTYDQYWVNQMQFGDDSFLAFVFLMNFFEPDDSNLYYDYCWVYPDDMVNLPYAETFINQQVTNVSSSGIRAFDITDLILSGNVSFLSEGEFWSETDTTPPSDPDTGIGTLVAQSEDVINLILNASEENPSQNEAWTVINNYYENYPSVTIAPPELASQLAGSSALSSGLGKIQIPEQLVLWMNNGITIREVDSDFHYDLSVSGLDPDDSTLASMINFDILNVAIVASKKTVNDSLVIHPIKMCNWDYQYENDPNDNYTVDVDLLANISYDDLWEMYDLVFIVDPDSPWLLDPDDEFDLSHITSYFYRFGYTGSDVKRGNMAVHDLSSQYPAYWVLTRSAFQKSQLYVFCDGFSKLYDLATQYCNKRDLWDSSFFEWSMSVFWELETVNGHLFALENEVLGWKLSTQFELLFDKLETLSNNIVDPDLSDVDPWYLPLWNWVNRFAPSVNDFSNSIDVMDDTFDELPAIPQVTDPPAIPTLPGFD